MGGAGRAGRQRRRRLKRPALGEREVAEIGGLRKWLLAGGMSACLLREAAFSDTGRGLSSRRKLRAGQLLVAVPTRLIITSSTVLSSCVGPIISRNAGRLSPTEALCLFLLVERSRGDSSFWQPYLRTLPTEFSTLLYLSDAELDAMLPPDLAVAAQRLRSRVLASYETVRRLVDSDRQPLLTGGAAAAAEVAGEEALLRCITPREFMWAWHVVNTRSLYCDGSTRGTPTADHVLNTSTDKDVYSLVPFVDLLNHSPSSKVKCIYNASTSTFDVVAIDCHRRHEQVFLCYGPHSNRILLLEYGFLVPSNPQSVVPFSLDELVAIFTDLPVAERQRKAELIRNLKLDRGLCCDGNGCSWNLMAACKILCGSRPCDLYQDATTNMRATSNLRRLLLWAIGIRSKLKTVASAAARQAELCDLLVNEETRMLQAACENIAHVS